ncbi:MAG: hypothetical protein HYX66_05820 [Ignavibacteria bacterium]|nr:hypothetical protein [Ignavibacteria bacterium]
MHFITPTRLEDWKSYNVAGVVGVLVGDENGQYRVLDAFDCDSIPSTSQLTSDERFGSWVSAAGSLDNVRFDVFLMPKAERARRSDVITLLERSCGFTSNAVPAYAHAV